MTDSAIQPTGQGFPAEMFSSFDDAIEAFAEAGITVAQVSDTQLVEKDTLVGKPFLITSWRVNTDKTTGRPFVSVEAITMDNERIVFNDGSTGVMQQLEAQFLPRLGHRGGVMAANGLRVSEYPTKNGKPLPPDSKDKPDGVGRTFYLS